MDNKVVVGVRCRPVTAVEALQQQQSHDFFTDSDPKSVITNRNKYKFTHVFTPMSMQNEIFNTMGKTLVEKVCEGYNGTILAYGQTGSGKSYTMGTEIMSASQGLTFKVLTKLFDRANPSVNISIVEIYREEVYDLLTKQPTKLNVLQGLKAVNMAVKTVHTPEQGQEVIMLAIKNRRIGATKFNSHSSRSHMIITLCVTDRHGHASKLNLVDLAGSEKMSEDNIQHQEGVAINSGLLHLLRVVHSLSNGSSYVPYRDSKLTFLLKDSLSTTNYIALIACINSIKRNLEETEKTLDFASKFANIEVTPLIGVQKYGTPYKTPQRQNKTFCSTIGTPSEFKKPLVPLNRTVATPISWTMKRKEESLVRTPIMPIPDFRRQDSSDSLNMSSVSTSTAITESSPDRLDESLPNLRLITPQLNALFQAQIDATVKATEKRMKQFFRRKLNDLGKQENKASWNKRLSEVGLDKSLDDSISLSDGVSSSDEGSLLQRTVLETTISSPADLREGTPTAKPLPPSVRQEPILFKLPQLPSTKVSVSKDANLNGSYISDDSHTPDNTGGGDSDSGLSSHIEVSFKKPAQRRSMRLSVASTRPFVNVYSDETPDGKGGDSDSGLSSHIEVSFKKPAPRRSMRLSVASTRPFVNVYSDETPDGKGGDSDSGSHIEAGFKKPAPRRSMRLSVASTRPFVNGYFDETPDSKVNRGRPILSSPLRSPRVFIERVQDEEKKRAGRKPKFGPSKNVVSDDNNLSHEEKILKILRTGTTKELEKLPIIGPKTAALILVDRQLNGPINDFGDFQNIRGLTKNQAKKFLWANSLV